MSKFFEGFEAGEDIQEEKDSLGGFVVLESDAYKLLIEKAYITYSSSKACCVNLGLKGENGELLNQAIYISSGEAKGCKNYYVDKQGKKQYLPGYNQINSICLLTIGKTLMEMDPEEGAVMIYDRDAGKEIPKEVPILKEIIGEEILLGVLKVRTNKQEKNDDDEYVATAEERFFNEIDKVFRTEDKLTVQEIKGGLTEPVFFDKWIDKWQGNQKDTYKSIEGSGVQSGSLGGGNKQTSSLFKKK